MTLLEKIRNKTGLLIAVIGVTLLVFILGDFLYTSSNSLFEKRLNNIAAVNGEIIHYSDYQEQVKNYINDAKDVIFLTDEKQSQIRQIILDKMIDKILLFQKAKKLGLSVTKEEYKDLVMGNTISPILQQISIFQDPKTKKFNKTALLQFLQIVERNDYSTFSEEQAQQLNTMKKVWLNIEEQIIEEQLQKKYSILVYSSILTNCLEAKALYEKSKISVDFKYVAQAYHTIPNKEITVSDSEIKKLYDKRKNLYKQRETVVIDYIVSEIIPSKSDFQSVENRLNSLRELLKSSKDITEIVQNNSDIPYIDSYKPYDKLDKNQKQFVNEYSIGSVSEPILTNKTYDLFKLEGIKTSADSIKLNLLPLSSFAEEPKLKHLCDSLILRLKKGTFFPDLALKISNGKTNGELGWMTESQLVTQMGKTNADKILKVKINEPTIISSATNTFLVQVTKKTKPVKKYKIADIQIRVVPSKSTKMQLYNRIRQFISLNYSLASMKGKAKKTGFTIYTKKKVTKNQISIDGIQNTRQIVQWAFDNKKGSISNIYECQNSEYFVVAAIEEHLKEGFLPLISVSNFLKKELINKKKKEKLIAYYKSKSFKTLEQYAKAMNTVPQSVQCMRFGTVCIPTIGEEPILIAKALQDPIRQISGPYAGKEKIYVLYITNKKINQKPYEAEKYEKQMQQYNIYLFHQIFQLSDLLRENAKIKNYFNRFF